MLASLVPALVLLQEAGQPETDTTMVRVIAAVGAVVLIAIIVLRRRSKKKQEDEF